MKKLGDKISVETWKKIAEGVQRLRIYDFSIDEFNYNLNLLRNIFSDLDVSCDILSRYPNRVEEIGLAALLQAIYSGEVSCGYKKANFYEKIFQLDELGIPFILFRPVVFPDRINGISISKSFDNVLVHRVKKCLTDGYFKINYGVNYLDGSYDLVNISDANYLINVGLYLDDSLSHVMIDENETYAVLKNFNGDFPSEKEFLDMRHPGLCSCFKNLDEFTRIMILKQTFNTFDFTKVGHYKRLVKDPGNYHYE